MRLLIRQLLLKLALHEHTHPVLNKQLLEGTDTAVTQKEKEVSSDSQGSAWSSPTAERLRQPPLQLKPGGSQRQDRQPAQLQIKRGAPGYFY